MAGTSMEEQSALFPSEQHSVNKPIPNGMQLRFRWHHNYHHHKAARGFSRRDSEAMTSGDRNSPGKVWHWPGGWTKFGTFQEPTLIDQAGGDLPGSAEPATIPSLLLAISVLLSGGFLLLFLIGLCLVHSVLQKVKVAKRNQPVSRELQIVLVPKRRPSSLLAMAPAAMQTLNPGQQTNNYNISNTTIHTTTDIVGTIGRWLPKASSQHNENAIGQKTSPNAVLLPLLPLPRRIYELQAEEGYFSCPPSKRASFEIDCR